MTRLSHRLVLRGDGPLIMPFSTVQLQHAFLFGALILLQIVARTGTAVQAAAPLRVKPHFRHPSFSEKQNRPVGESLLFDPELQNVSAATQYTNQAELDLRLCVVVRFYDKQANALRLLLFSLFASAHPHIKALVIDTGKQPYKKLPSLLRRVNQASRQPSIREEMGARIRQKDRKRPRSFSGFPPRGLWIRLDRPGFGRYIEANKGSLGSVPVRHANVYERGQLVLSAFRSGHAESHSPRERPRRVSFRESLSFPGRKKYAQLK